MFNLARPLGLEEMDKEGVADHLRSVIAIQEAAFREQRGNRPPLGIDAILRQNPFDKPKTSARKPKRRFACESKAKLDERMESFRRFVGDYATVYQQFKENLKSTSSFHNEWPIGSYPPSRWRPFSAVGT